MVSHTKENSMKASAQFRVGLERAAKVTGISTRKASIDAGFNQHQLKRFMSGKTNIKLSTLDTICTDGFGLPFVTIYRMGE